MQLQRMNRLAPLSEEPIDEQDGRTRNRNRSGSGSGGGGSGGGRSWRNWIRTHLSILSCGKKSDGLNVLLSVLGCPLFPVSVQPNNFVSSANQVSSSSQYIIEHFAAATGCRKLNGRVKNIFATGKLTMGLVDEVSSGGGGGGGSGGGGGPTGGVTQKGCFVMWQMIPNKWLIELAVGGHSIVAGSDGNVAWRHTPWLGSHAAKGAVRPLRRAFQGLDPLAISEVFSPAQYMGEKQMMGVDCFVLKLSVDQTDLVNRSDNTAEMIKHAIHGYFCQKRGLLVYLEDSSLTRIQSPGSHPMYWETTMSTKIGDYRSVDGVMIAHSGETNVIITRFGDDLKTGPMITRMQESWSIDDVAFNVPGLSMDSFIPPQQVKKD
ncbi:uncharacterized protein LOC111789880 [Cucurbita pepo subsp. pepo]|uniref:uncharacterized protein LOC111789880 n=1 Tax=Cucurbita pepo subsp. pepo TaxID=3664 RepID=UPI000C9D4C84|nr:uncharacterized protein LOC111789880 [Cucurbita pepo subsp. pepo]